MTFLRLLPSVLALLLLAAHLLRWGGPGLALPVLLAIALVFIRRIWAARALQAILGLACLEWLRTAWVLAVERRAAGAPFLRMLAILLVVAAFTAGAAWLAGPGRKLGVLARLSAAQSSSSCRPSAPLVADDPVRARRSVPAWPRWKARWVARCSSQVPVDTASPPGAAG